MRAVRLPAKKRKKPTQRCGLLVACFPRERQYAELSYLLPFYLGLAVKTRCIGPSSWHVIYIYPSTVRIFGYASVGHGVRPQPILWLKCWHAPPRTTPA